MSQKIVLKVQLNCQKCVRRAMETLSGIEGVVSIAVDEKDQKITVIGDADPVNLAASLRKFGFADLVSVGPSKEPDKKPPVPDKKPETDKQDKKPETGQKQAEKKPNEPKALDKKAADKQEASQQNFTYIILPTSCDHCSSYTYYWSDENPNVCCIV